MPSWYAIQFCSSSVLATCTRDIQLQWASLLASRLMKLPSFERIYLWKKNKNYKISYDWMPHSSNYSNCDKQLILGDTGKCFNFSLTNYTSYTKHSGIGPYRSSIMTLKSRDKLQHLWEKLVLMPERTMKKRSNKSLKKKKKSSLSLIT